MTKIRRFGAFFLLFSLLSGLFSPVRAQQPDPYVRAQTILSRMTTQEKVGQLFLIGFAGSDLRDTSPIYHLINDYRIGGVILSRSADNFDTDDDLPAHIQGMTTSLQQIANLAATSQQSSGYIPLLIGISQNGDGWPYDEILSELTPLPSLMALGAGWNDDLAYETGKTLGMELSTLGFNLILGPSLDVMDGWYQEGSESLGTATLGGNPYWVSRLGEAYLLGMRDGSTDNRGNSRLLIAAGRFPGLGSADRNPQNEIPTIRKTLDQLKSNELAPFFRAVSQVEGERPLSDALVVANARYQGLQGVISEQTTRPIGLDQASLNDLLRIEPLLTWRSNGGLLISDNLGNPALRSFLDPSGLNYDVHQVARSMFMAGNDILVMDRVVSSTEKDSFLTLSNTLAYFTQIYEVDAAFAQRVDASVMRILVAKQRLYPDWTIDAVTPPADGLANLAASQSSTAQAAAAGATLISPDAASLSSVLPRPPSTNDRITILTDDQRFAQCSTCVERTTVSVSALQSEVVRLYGSTAGGQISRSLLESYSFSDLNKIFTPHEQTIPVEESIRLADWLVVLLQREEANRPDSAAFSQLLAHRPDLIRNKRIVVFALDAPYYLDATEISKISAYYGLYGKSPAFIELAARILFQEHIPSGALPVSLPGIGIMLEEQLKPDPGQMIALSLDTTPEENGAFLLPDQPLPVPSFKVGDTLRLRTSVLLDHNQRQVPDGTIVRFSFALGNEPGLAQTMESITFDGIARVSYKIERGERLEVTASSEGAVNSTHLILDITGGQGAVITVIAPTPQPTTTMQPTEAPQPTEPSPTPAPPPPQERTTQVKEWFIAVLTAVLASVLIRWLSAQIYPMRWSLRMALCTAMGVMAVFTWLSLGLPGSRQLLMRYQTTGVLIVSLAGALLGALACRVWHWRELRRIPYSPVPNTPPRPR